MSVHFMFFFLKKVKRVQNYFTLAVCFEVDTWNLRHISFYTTVR